MKILMLATQFKGGSLQVAISLLNEFKKFPENEYHIILGDVIAKQLNVRGFPNNFTFYPHPFSGPISPTIYFKRKSFLDNIEKNVNPECVLTTSGPLYWHTKVPTLVGFNLPNNVYEDSPFFKLVPRKKRVVWYLKKIVHRFFFKRDTTAYFVQTDDVNERLRKYVNSDRVFTISNTFNNYFIDKPVFPNKLPERQNGEIRLLTISTWYPHKNFEIIKPLIKELDKRGLSDVRFVLTLKNEHYDKIFGKEYHQRVINVGTVEAAMCPSLYNECDFMFLPTLLECFSASYAEAMIMKKPILTSNLSFATTVCKSAALYFDPLNPMDIADKIGTLLSDANIQQHLIDEGTKQMENFGNAEDRAKQILELCNQIIIK